MDPYQLPLPTVSAGDTYKKKETLAELLHLILSQSDCLIIDKRINKINYNIISKIALEIIIKIDMFYL